MMHCTSYQEERNKIIHLQQPYIESRENILGHFQFDKENIEEKKELLFAIWKRRQIQMK